MPLPPGKDEWQMPYPSGTENWEIPHPIPAGDPRDSLDTSITMVHAWNESVVFIHLLLEQFTDVNLPVLWIHSGNKVFFFKDRLTV